MSDFKTLEQLAFDAKRKISIADQYITEVSNIPTDEQKKFVHNEVIKAKKDIDDALKMKHKEINIPERKPDGTFNIVLRDTSEDPNRIIKDIRNKIIKSADSLANKPSITYYDTDVIYRENPVNPKLVRQNIILKRKVNELQAEVNRLNEEIKQLNTKIKQLTSQLNTERKNVTTLRAHNAELINHISTLETYLMDRTNELTMCKANVVTLTDNLKAIADELKLPSNSDSKTIINEIQARETNLQSQIRELKLVIMNVEQKFNDEKKNLTAIIAQLEQKVTVLTADLAQQENYTQSYAKREAEKNTKIFELKQELEDEKKRSSGLSIDLQEMEAESEKFQNQFTNIAQRLQQEQKERKNVEFKLQQEEKERKNVEFKLQQEQKNNSAIQDRLAQEQKEKNNEELKHNEEMKSTYQQLSDAKQQLSDAKQQLSDAKQQLSDAKTTYDKELNDLNNKLEIANGGLQYEESENKRTKKQILEIEKDMRRLKEILNNGEEKNFPLTGQSGKDEWKITQLMSELKNDKNVLEELKNNITKLSSEIKRSNDMVTEYKDNNRKLSEINEKIKSELANSRNNNDILKQKLEELQNEFKGKQSEFDRNKKLIEEQNDKMAVLNRENNDIRMKYNKNLIELQKLKNQLDTQIKNRQDDQKPIQSTDLSDKEKKINEEMSVFKNLYNSNLTELKEKTDSVHELMRKNTALEQEMEKSRNILNGLKEDLRNKNDENLILQSLLEKKNTEIDELQNDSAMTREIANNMTNIKNDHDVLSKENEDLKKKLQNTLDKHQKELSFNEKKADEKYQKRDAQLQASITDSYKRGLVDNNATLTEYIRNSKIEIGNLKKNYEDQITEIKKLLDAANQQNLNHENKIKSLKEIINENKSALDQKETEINKLENNITKLTVDNKQNIKRNAILEKELEETKAKLITESELKDKAINTAKLYLKIAGVSEETADKFVKNSLDSKEEPENYFNSNSDTLKNEIIDKINDIYKKYENRMDNENNGNIDDVLDNPYKYRKKLLYKKRLDKIKELAISQNYYQYIDNIKKEMENDDDMVQELIKKYKAMINLLDLNIEHIDEDKSKYAGAYNTIKNMFISYLENEITEDRLIRFTNICATLNNSISDGTYENYKHYIDMTISDIQSNINENSDNKQQFEGGFDPDLDSQLIQKSIVPVLSVGYITMYYGMWALFIMAIILLVYVIWTINLSDGNSTSLDYTKTENIEPNYYVPY
jgi:hypothetical protein